MWQWQLPALTPHFSVLTYDLLGHGESARPTGTPDLAMFSAQLLGSWTAAVSRARRSWGSRSAA